MENERKQMIQYLLGELSEEEMAQVEERYFSDDEYFDRLEAVEEELIESYAREELSAEERVQFEKHFLASPQRRERVEFTRTLMECVAESTEAPAPGVSRWESLLTRLGGENRGLRFSIAAVVLAVVLGGSCLIIEIWRLRTELERMHAEQTLRQRQEREPQPQTAPPAISTGQLIEQLQRERERSAQLEKELAERQPSRLTTVSFVLTASLTRDIEGQTRLIIPQGANLVELRLALEQADQYRSFRAVLRTVEGNEVWSQDELRARRTDSGRVVILRLPSSVLTPDDYILTLRGLTSEGRFEDAADYYFRVAKR